MTLCLNAFWGGEKNIMKKALVGFLAPLTVVAGLASAQGVKADEIMSGNTSKVTTKHSGKALDVAANSNDDSGDHVIIMSYASLTPEETNQLTRLTHYKKAGRLYTKKLNNNETRIKVPSFFVYIVIIYKMQ